MYHRIAITAAAGAVLALAAGCSSSHPVGNAAGPIVSATPAAATASPSPTHTRSVMQHGAVMPSAGYTAILHVGQTVGLPADAEDAGVDETWTLNSAHYISYAESQEGRANYNDVAEQAGENEPRPNDQFVVLGLTVRNVGTKVDTEPVITQGLFNWETQAGKVGQTELESVEADSTGLLAPYNSNAQPADINNLNPGQSVTGYVVTEVPDAPSVIVADAMLDGTAIVVDPMHLIHGTTCLNTAKQC